MFVRIFDALQDHALLAQVALMVVTLIGFLHLLMFLMTEVMDVGHKLYLLFRRRV